MIRNETAFDGRVEEVARQVQSLEARVEELSAQVQALRAPMPAGGPAYEPEPGGSSLAWPTTPVLPAVAAVCFLLVVALVLRTIVDGGITQPALGLAMGTAYAALLVLYGCYRYAEGKRLAAVFCVCGFLLLYAILVESHSRFGLLSPPAVYGGLALGVLAAALPGRRYTPASALCIGVAGAAVAGVFLEFPEPRFPYLAGLLLLVNAAAYRACALPRCGWVKWGVLGATLFFWTLWAVRVRALLSHAEDDAADVSLVWLAPWLAAFSALYVAMAIVASRGRGGHFGWFEAVLPTVAGVGGYAVISATLSPAWSAQGEAATAGLIASGAFLVLGARLAGRSRDRAYAATAFVLPALMTLALSLPHVVPAGIAAVAMSAAALAVGLVSARWRSRSVRVCSYGAQAYACAGAVAAGLFAAQSPLSIPMLAVAVSLTGLAAAHYAGSRWWTARHDGTWLDSIDPQDRSAVLCVFTAAVAAFAAGRMLLFPLFPEPGESMPVFQANQSVLLCVEAFALGLLGLLVARGELLAVAAAVGAVAAAKVFGYDLFTIRGVPLVASVFSFGLMAAFGSIVWGRWQRSTRPE